MRRMPRERQQALLLFSEVPENGLASALSRLWHPHSMRAMTLTEVLAEVAQEPVSGRGAEGRAEARVPFWEGANCDFWQADKEMRERNRAASSASRRAAASQPPPEPQPENPPPPVHTSGGKESSSKDQKSASGGKANKHDREKAQKPASGSKSVKDEDRSRSPGRTHGQSPLRTVLERQQSPSSATGGRHDSRSPSPSPSIGRRRNA